MAPPSRGGPPLLVLLVTTTCLFGPLLQSGSDATKQGHCPSPSEPDSIHCKRSCLTDENCEGDFKCCKNGCSYQCSQPVDNRQRHHKKPGAHHPVDGNKIGVCPMLSESRVCQSSCQNDHDCRGDYKCCLTSCGYDCVPPERPFNSEMESGHDSELITPKAGRCPPDAELPRNCEQSSCSDNESCPGQLICCPTNCGKECVEAEDEFPAFVEERSGNCPNHKLIPDSCEIKCQDDSVCPENQKCCYNGCGNDCADIDYSTPGEVSSEECPQVCEGMCQDDCSRDEHCGGSGFVCLYKPSCGMKCIPRVPSHFPSQNQHNEESIEQVASLGVCEDHQCDEEEFCEVEMSNCDDESSCILKPLCVSYTYSCRKFACEHGSRCVWSKPCQEDTCKPLRKCIPDSDLQTLATSDGNDSGDILHMSNAILLLCLFLIFL